MTWSNLLSGLIGALVGGVFSLLATVITIRHERSRVRREASHTASDAIKENMLTIRQAMFDIQWAMDPSNDSSDPSVDPLLETVRAAAQRILYLYSDPIADETLRSRIDIFVDMVEVWYKNARQSSRTVNQKRIESIESYMGYVNESIKAHRNDLQLPPDQPPPDVRATENA
jgi:hypothetical protein